MMANKIILDIITGKFVDTGEPTESGLIRSAMMKSIIKARPPEVELIRRARISSSLKSKPSGMLGKHHSPETKRKMSIKQVGNKERISRRLKERWQDPEFAANQGALHSIKPNKAELQLQAILNKYFPNIYKYVGDFQVTIGGRCPDFININSRKEVIEFFGNYWHNSSIFPDRLSQEETITHYKAFGFTCVVIWEEELRDKTALLEHIKKGDIYIPRYSYSKARKCIILDGETKKFKQVAEGLEGESDG